ncbi:MAG: hypothetical protein JXR48_10590 [Candidatus Delongbacteria bacterium]|nr:hypothetical protein [Candidatus Delongbacteria bacterium]MBN2835399.1 hypothetical protein [Candidatus Delongbacteria bacterium]
MKKFFLVFIALFSILMANNSEKIEGTGYGDSQESAFKSAMRDALIKVVGTYITSTSIVDNYTLINDQIINFSSGFVEDTKTVSVNKDDSGLYTVVIEATVKKGEVKKKLESFKGIRMEFSVSGDKVDQAIAKVNFNKENMEELAKAFSTEIIEPVKTKKAHDIEIKSLEFLDPLEYQQSNNSLKVKNLSTDKNEEIHSIPFFESYDNIDKFMIVKASYKISLKKEYVENSKLFLKEFCTDIGENISLDDFDKEIRKNNYESLPYFLFTTVTELMRNQTFTNAYQIPSDKINHYLPKKLGELGFNKFEIIPEVTINDKSGFKISTISENGYGQSYWIVLSSFKKDIESRPIPFYFEIKNQDNISEYNLKNTSTIPIGLGVGGFSITTGIGSIYFSGLSLAPKGNINYFIINDYDITYEDYFIVEREESKKIGGFKLDLIIK